MDLNGGRLAAAASSNSLARWSFRPTIMSGISVAPVCNSSAAVAAPDKDDDDVLRAGALQRES